MSQFVEAEFPTDLIPKPVEYAVLLPPDYDKTEEPLPLLYFLHGGGGNRSLLDRVRPIFDRLWNEGRLPGLVAVTPGAGRSFYMDYKDGSEKWESLLVGPFLAHLRNSYNVPQDRAGLYVAGVSMGGMGALRLGFKYPELFSAIAALEPGIEPALAFKDIQSEDRFWRPVKLFETIFGSPVDEEYWALNNPASIVVGNADRIRSSKLGIYLECGDEDSFGLYRGTEFLHRILWDNGIPHEYHSVRGADHLGQTLGTRLQEALQFLAGLISPPPPDPEVSGLRKMVSDLKEQAGRSP